MTEIEPPEWTDIFEHPSVLLILGSRGSGKTALGHRLLEVFAHGNDDIDAYIMGFPAEEADRLPDWIDPLPSAISMDDWPEDSVVLLHEAHQIMHARRSMDVENLEIDQLLTVSRHRNTTVITETQQSQRLDRNAVTAVDGVIVREPALLQSEFERKQVRKIIKRADDVFDQYVDTIETEQYTWREKSEAAQKTAFIHSERFVGEYPHDIQLADHWSESISTVFSDAAAVDEEESGSSQDLNDGDRETLETMAEKLADMAPLQDYEGIEHDDIPRQYAWNNLTALSQEGLAEKILDTNSVTRYVLTDEGWAKSSVEKPDNLYEE